LGKERFGTLISENWFASLFLLEIFGAVPKRMSMTLPHILTWIKNTRKKYEENPMGCQHLGWVGADENGSRTGFSRV